MEKSYQQRITSYTIPITHSHRLFIQISGALTRSISINVFLNLVRGYNSHLLVKSQEPFRDVFKDAHALFSSSGNAVDTSLVSEGFDSDRWCSYLIEQTSGEFAGYPIQILHISKYYPK